MSYFNIVAQTTENTVVTEYEPDKTRSDSYQSEAALQKSIDAAARQYFSKFPVVPLQQRGHVFMRWYCFRYISRCRQPS